MRGQKKARKVNFPLSLLPSFLTVNQSRKREENGHCDEGLISLMVAVMSHLFNSSREGSLFGWWWRGEWNAHKREEASSSFLLPRTRQWGKSREDGARLVVERVREQQSKGRGKNGKKSRGRHECAHGGGRHHFANG